MYKTINYKIIARNLSISYCNLQFYVELLNTLFEYK